MTRAIVSIGSVIIAALMIAIPGSAGADEYRPLHGLHVNGGAHPFEDTPFIELPGLPPPGDADALLLELGYENRRVARLGIGLSYEFGQATEDPPGFTYQRLRIHRGVASARFYIVSTPLLDLGVGGGLSFAHVSRRLRPADGPIDNTSKDAFTPNLGITGVVSFGAIGHQWDWGLQGRYRFEFAGTSDLDIFAEDFDLSGHYLSVGVVFRFWSLPRQTVEAVP